MNNLFFYMPNSFRQPKGDTIKVGKVSGKLWPTTYQGDSKEVFIYGEGWRKIRKVLEIPVFSGDTPKSVEEYIERYSDECFYYSMTGYNIASNDCCNSQASSEFKSVQAIGYKRYQEFVTEINRLNKIIYDQVMEVHGVSIFKNERIQRTKSGKYMFRDNLFCITPRFTVSFYWYVAPHLDPVLDDDWLWKHAVNFTDDIKKLTMEFPVSVKDRLYWLFGQEVADGYEKLLTTYTMTDGYEEHKKSTCKS